MSPSKREREHARRRYAKRLARRERAAQARRRQQIIALAVIVGLALTGGVFLALNSGDSETDPAAEQTQPGEDAATPTDPGAAEDSDDGNQEPLPTTDPQRYDSAPSPDVAEDRHWQVTITTNLGPIEMTLDGLAAPQAVANFVQLAQDGYYDGTACHRLLPDSLLQCGDPTATGGGDPGYGFGPIENAPEDDLYPAGTLAMARMGNDGESMGSQFFMVFADVPLPADTAGGYTVFGSVDEGLDILAEVGAAGTGATSERPAQDVIIETVEVQ